MKFLLIVIMSLSPIIHSYACGNGPGDGYLPKNNLYIPDGHGLIQGIEKAEFDTVLDQVSTIYSSEISRFGGTLKIIRKWTDGTVNALARREGSNFVIEMFGGLARHSAITKDAFTLVACHEIGHHIGGAPVYNDASMGWASTEGQSDYFATAKCLRKVFQKEDNQQIVEQMKIDPTVQRECNQKHSDPNEQAICKRISMAGLSGASMFAVIQNQPMPKFDTPDPAVVGQTYESHPQYQCRLDTYFNGAVCDVSEDIDFSSTDPQIGACNQAANKNYGFRPLCWYKPNGGGNPNPTPDPSPAPAGMAQTPNVNGQTSITVNNPNTTIPIQIDVSNILGATGFAFEISKPNQVFSNPNGSVPDQSNGLILEQYQSKKGTYTLLPAKHLPGWGVYQIRVIALDTQTNAVSKNSNSFILNLKR